MALSFSSSTPGTTYNDIGKSKAPINEILIAWSVGEEIKPDPKVDNTLLSIGWNRSDTNVPNGDWEGEVGNVNSFPTCDYRRVFSLLEDEYITGVYVWYVDDVHQAVAVQFQTNLRLSPAFGDNFQSVNVVFYQGYTTAGVFKALSAVSYEMAGYEVRGSGMGFTSPNNIEFGWNAVITPPSRFIVVEKTFNPSICDVPFNTLLDVKNPLGHELCRVKIYYTTIDKKTYISGLACSYTGRTIVTTLVGVVAKDSAELRWDPATEHIQTAEMWCDTSEGSKGQMTGLVLGTNKGRYNKGPTGAPGNLQTLTDGRKYKSPTGHGLVLVGFAGAYLWGSPALIGTLLPIWGEIDQNAHT